MLWASLLLFTQLRLYKLHFPFYFPPCHSSGLAAGLCSGTIHQGNCMLISLKYCSHVYLYCCIISLPLACLQYALFVCIPCFFSCCNSIVCNGKYCKEYDDVHHTYLLTVMPSICVISVALVTCFFHGQKWQWCTMCKLGAEKLWLDFGMLEKVADVFHRARCKIYWADSKIHSPKYSWNRKASPWLHPS